MRQRTGWKVSIRSLSMSEQTYSIVVLVQIIGHHRFVSGQRLLQIGKSITRDSKRRRLDIMREFVKPALVSNTILIS